MKHTPRLFSSELFLIGVAKLTSVLSLALSAGGQWIAYTARTELRDSLDRGGRATLQKASWHRLKGRLTSAPPQHADGERNRGWMIAAISVNIFGSFTSRDKVSHISSK